MQDEFSVISEKIMDNYLRREGSGRGSRLFLRNGEFIYCYIDLDYYDAGNVVEEHMTSDGRYTYKIVYQIEHYMEMHSVHELRQSEYQCVLVLLGMSKDELAKLRTKLIQLSRIR